MLTFTLAQQNPTIGDFAGNLQLIRAAAVRGRQNGSKLVIFTELNLCAYYPQDLLDQEAFRKKIREGLTDLHALTCEFPELIFVVGAPTENQGPGKFHHNSLLAIQNGKRLLVYHKQLLPTYNVFDERRHFEPGPNRVAMLVVEGVHIAFLICEDGWNDAGEDYEVNPFTLVADASPDVLVIINGSPSSLGHRERRHRVFTRASAHYNLPIIYSNQVGGHDELVYDGASFLVEPTRGVVAELARFQEEIRSFQFDPTTRTFYCLYGTSLTPVNPAPMSLTSFYRQQTILALRDYMRRCGFKKVVVGCSGGIDSAITLALAVEAIGPQNVTAITMPSQYSSEGSITDSQTLCCNLGIELLIHPIKELVDAHVALYERTTGRKLQGTALENVQPRIRGTILMEYSNDTGALLLTTGNKSEVAVGYCTLYGDTNGGFSLIKDWGKLEVYAVSEDLNAEAGCEIIPRTILDKAPSAELAPGQKDSDNLPDYPILDPILKVLIEDGRMLPEESAEAHAVVDHLSSTEEGRRTIAHVHRLVHRNEFKRRQCPPGVRVRARAFGNGWQMPIAAKYD